MNRQFYFQFICLSLACVVQIGQAADWCYYEDQKCGPKTWSGQCQTGSVQSPIDLPYSSRARTKTADLYQNSQYFTKQNFQVKNNGHTVQVSLSPDLTSTATITGSMLRGQQYTFSSLHFHWGDQDDRGSEHTINRRRFPMEVHLVHYRSDFSSLSDAIASNQSDALAVLGTFFDFYNDDGDNHALDPILRTFSKIKAVGNSTTGTDLNLSWFLPQSNYQEVQAMQYEGSLTTPECNQIVLWNVFLLPAPVSTRQMNLFRTYLKSAHGGQLVNNYRPPQDHNLRAIDTLRSAVRGH